MNIKILLSGDGGQGIQLLADIICVAAFQNNLHISFIPNYGLEQRGGVSLAYLKISDKEIGYPRFTNPDILLIMSEQARDRTLKNVSNIKEHGGNLIDIKDYKEILENKNILQRSYNIFFLGIIAKILQEKNIYATEQILELLKKKLGVKPGWEENEKAFDIGNNIEIL
jgi:2-oxoglutarate ferredoxin oxidoreductase subunit gamma